MAMCCTGKEPAKGKVYVQTFNKIDPPKRDGKFGLKGVGGSYGWDPKLKLSNVRSAHCPLPNKPQQFVRLLKGELSSYAQKQILKSQYEELLEKYNGRNDKWTDPDFPPNDKSWGAKGEKVVWKRATDIIKNPQFVSDNFTPADILQGKIGNCYFLSAIAGLAERPYRIRKIFPNTNLNANGIYVARLLHKGVYQEVIVDDYFPCNQSGVLLGSQPAGGSQIWVMVLEKCWAKLFGSYASIDGGLPNEVLHAFSAAPTYNYSVASYRDHMDELFHKMIEADSREQIICCGTEPENWQGDLQKVGLVGGHAYTVLGVFEEPIRMIKLRNPWGSMEWKGTASDNDRRFWSRIPAADQLNLGYANKDDGTFFMLWQDFQKFFVIVDICWINDNANYFYRQSIFKRGQPHFFDFQTMGGDLTLALTQPSKRQLKATGKPNAKLAPTTLILGKEYGNNQYQYVTSKSGQNYSELFLKLYSLQAGKYTVCGFAEGTTQIQSTLSIYSGSNITLVENDQSDIDFLNKCYLDHARKNDEGRQVLSPSPLEWVTFDILTDKCGFGYSAFHIDQRSTRKLGLQFQQKEYLQNGLQLLAPYKGANNFKIIVEPGQEVIVLCRMAPDTYVREFMMPVPKMFRLRSS